MYLSLKSGRTSPIAVSKSLRMYRPGCLNFPARLTFVAADPNYSARLISKFASQEEPGRRRIC